MRAEERSEEKVAGAEKREVRRGAVMRGEERRGDERRGEERRFKESRREERRGEEVSETLEKSWIIELE